MPVATHSSDMVFTPKIYHGSNGDVVEVSDSNGVAVKSGLVESVNCLER